VTVTLSTIVIFVALSALKLEESPQSQARLAFVWLKPHTVMPARKKARKGASEVAQPSQSSSSITRTIANVKGLPTLPVELILIILSFLPHVPVPCRQRTLLTDDTYFRNHALFALSQTCRWLRQIIFPFVWQSFEVCRLPSLESSRAMQNSSQRAYTQSDEVTSTGSRHHSRKQSRILATELVKQIEIVTIRDMSRAETIQ
jgi:hypothetical protein